MPSGEVRDSFPSRDNWFLTCPSSSLLRADYLEEANPRPSLSPGAPRPEEVELPIEVFQRGHEGPVNWRWDVLCPSPSAKLAEMNARANPRTNAVYLRHQAGQARFAKPADLYVYLFRRYGGPGPVLDCFCGCGPALLAAEATGTRVDLIDRAPAVESLMIGHVPPVLVHRQDEAYLPLEAHETELCNVVAPPVDEWDLHLPLLPPQEEPAPPQQEEQASEQTTTAEQQQQEQAFELQDDQEGPLIPAPDDQPYQWPPPSDELNPLLDPLSPDALGEDLQPEEIEDLP